MKTKSQRAAALEVMVAAQKQYELAMIELENHVDALEQQVASCDVDMKAADKDYVEQIERRREAEQERDAALATIQGLHKSLSIAAEIVVRKDEQNAALRSLARDCITLIANVFSPDVSDEGLANWIDASVIIFDRAKQLQVIGAEQDSDKGDRHV